MKWTLADTVKLHWNMFHLSFYSRIILSIGFDFELFRPLIIINIHSEKENWTVSPENTVHLKKDGEHRNTPLIWNTTIKLEKLSHESWKSTACLDNALRTLGHSYGPQTDLSLNKFTRKIKHELLQSELKQQLTILAKWDLNEQL